MKKFLLMTLCLFMLPSFTYAKVTVIPEIEVVGEPVVKEKSEVSIQSETLPSAVQVITGEDLKKMNVRHYLDIFRKSPGIITSHYGQGDVADGLGMRGYSSGHGSQVAIFVDGVPINVPHHSHSHGFGDIGWIVPEMIERVEIIKGPFSALYGNFALGGVINIITKKSDKSPSIGAEVGSFGLLRGVATISKGEGKAIPFLVYEAHIKDGYRDNSDYERYNLFNKLTVPLWNGNLSIRAHYVKREWGAPGYLFVDDVRNGVRKRTDAIESTDGGDSEYYNLVLNYSPKKEAGFHGTVYAAKEDHNRFATFVPSPQRWEHNERVYYGWNLLYNFLPKKNLSVVIGTDGRYDDGTMQRFDTVKRVVTKTSRDWDIKELSLGLFSQVQWKPIDYFKLVGGIRYDYFDFDIENKVRPANSGTGNTSIISPKIGFVINPAKNLSIFANKGLGFRSPSAMEMSPPTATPSKNFNLKPAKVDTWDVGFNTILFEKLNLAFDYYQTDMEREIRTVGAETINIGKSKRDGYEVEIKFYATNELTVFANYAWVKARIKNPTVVGADRVTGVPKDYITGGIEWAKQLGKDKTLSLELSTQVLGKAPLNAAGTVIRDNIDRYISKLTYTTKNITAFAGTVYHPKKYVSEGMFIMNNRLAYDPKPVWDVSAGVKYQF